MHGEFTSVLLVSSWLCAVYMKIFYFQAMNAVIKTWRDGPYIFIVQIGITTAKDSTTKDKRMEKTPPSLNQNKSFTSKIAVYTVS